MTKSMIQPLESCRLIQYAVPVPCHICGTDNTLDSEFCNHCFAPMALAHQSCGRKTQPQMLAALGASGAGKTVYLGMLIDMLSRQPERMQLLARGAFSITLQQTTLAALSRCEFPQKTPNEPDRWNWVHCQIRRRQQRQPLELIMPDMAGEALLEEVDHPHTFRVVRSFLQKCTGALVLIDTMRLEESSQDQDYFTLKLLTYLNELDNDDSDDTRWQKSLSWKNRPVALVFSKADHSDLCSDDPEGYAKTQAPALWQFCQERFHRHRFFAASVAGTCVYRESLTEGRMQVPLRIEPQGVVEPFQWLLEELDSLAGKRPKR